MVSPIPLVVRDTGVTTLTWSVSILSTAAASLALRRADFFTVALLLFAPGRVMRELKELPLAAAPLMVSWRSCVHSPLTLPAGRLALRLLEVAATAGARCYIAQKRDMISGSATSCSSKSAVSPTFFTPTRLAREPPGAGFSFEGALCRRSRLKILSARAEFFFRSRAMYRCC